MVQVIPIPISFTLDQQEHQLYPVVLQTASARVMVDCGYESNLPLLEAALLEREIAPADITHIIITHHDIDHMGGLWAWKNQYPQVRVYTALEEIPYVSGTRKSLRQAQAEAGYEQLPEAYKPWAAEFIRRHQALRTVVPDGGLEYDEVLPFMPEVQVIATPGHMPHHISLYIPNSATLITADALVIEDGQFNIANPAFVLDLKAAVQSIASIRSLTLERVICYHGGEMHTGIYQSLDRLLDQYKTV